MTNKELLGQRVHDPCEIDICSHGVIEASAGTGKTYTIENLVVRMLLERPLQINQILLVTFTEKAAGELKERIREKIKAELLGQHGDSVKLRDALANFDTAKVFTIHGFCQNVLRQYAFENGGSFEAALVDDAPLYYKVLHDTMRNRWPVMFGDNLREVLAFAGYPDVKAGESGWERLVLAIAQRYNPEAKDILLPEPVEDLNRLFVQCREQVKDLLLAVAELDRLPDSLEGQSGYLKACYQQAGEYIKGPSFKSRVAKILLPLETLLEKVAQGSGLLGSYLTFIKSCEMCSGFSELGFNLLLGSTKKQAPEDMEAAFPIVAKMIELLERLRCSVDVQKIHRAFQTTTIQQLKRDVRAYKKDQGQISFDDMLTLVHQALHQGNGLLEEVLRKEYTVALVDEFQDTDRVQWEIFKKIFLVGTQEGHNLFIVGDPKQAIYSFRGADVYTYLDAKQEMLNTYGARLYTLDTNWRSEAMLINSFNKFFSSNAWFGAGEIGYCESFAAPEDKKRTAVSYDFSDRKNVTIVNLSQSKKDLLAAKIKKNMASFIANEIKKLLYGEKGGAAFCFGPEGEKIEAGDIAVLLRSRSEAYYVEKALDEAGVPHSFYKKPGLYNSEEALHLHYLLAAVARLDERQAVMKGLLTRFFREKLSNIDQYMEHPGSHPSFKLLEKWQALALNRKWALFFRSILEESALLLQEAQESNGERRVTNYYHICQNLEVEAEKNSLDLLGLVNLLAAYRSGALNAESETEMHRQETELAKVQLMTIHASKGLEFPVVFLGGGFTDGVRGSYCFYNKKEKTGENRNVFDLSGSNKARQLHKEYLQREDKRLFYVALTRAQYKLYLPFIEPDAKLSKEGPVKKIVSAAIATVWPEQSASVDISWQNFDTQKLIVTDLCEYSSEEIVSWDGALFEECRLDFLKKDRLLYSFSGLKNQTVEVGERYGEESQNETHADETTEELQLVTETSEVAGATVLPRGASTGSMLHEIFEEIDYCRVGEYKSAIEFGDDSSFVDLALQKIQRFKIRPVKRALPEGVDAGVAEKLLLDEIASIVWNTLTCKMEPHHFSLQELTPEKRLHELEFFYPVPDMEDGSTLTRKEQMTGFIDLVFEHQGKFYILDWKSNYLPEYSYQSMEGCMQHSGYDWQYEIYTIAVCRWLAQRVPGFVFEKHFGGIYYLFVRGIQPGTESGIFYKSSQDMASVSLCEQRLGLLVDGAISARGKF